MGQPLTVCILTAGRGTRMGNHCATLHKGLLPLGKKAIISHIIEKFPSDTKYVIALGDRAEQVKAYIEAAHPNRLFTFQMVDNYTQPGSGPGYSLLCCREHLPGEFFFVACDTVWNATTNLPTDSDWFGVANIDPEISASYCNFEVDQQQRIIAIRDKEKVCGPQYSAFIGLCFVKSYDHFWRGLKQPKMISGEHQISSGIESLVARGDAKALMVDWIDTGDKEKYERAITRFECFDFSKPEESIFINEKRVIKYFADHKISAKRVKRARLNSEVFPQVSDEKEGFYYYSFVEGKTLFEQCNPEIFSKLLNWLDAKLWKEIKVEPAEFNESCQGFYKKKTTERISKYLAKYPESLQLTKVNGVTIRPPQELIEAIPWEQICQGKPSFFHGDLQFDNILYDEQRDAFTLLDWRQDFAGKVEFGDLYYDLAKLTGGLTLNYDYIKAGLFTYQESGTEVYVDCAQRMLGNSYRQILEKFIGEKGLSVKKVQLMVPVIYLNMAPLHHYPFDKFLFALGCSLLQKELALQPARSSTKKSSSATLTVERGSAVTDVVTSKR
jgi:NDP-sugar pyrophosphorylase family protein